MTGPRLPSERAHLLDPTGTMVAGVQEGAYMLEVSPKSYKKDFHKLSQPRTACHHIPKLKVSHEGKPGTGVRGTVPPAAFCLQLPTV